MLSQMDWVVTALRRCQRRWNFEASGGETLERLAEQISLTEGTSNVPALALLVAAVQAGS
jgi:hypothetical protein